MSRASTRAAIFLEVFSGSGVLSSAFRKLGFNCVTIDWSGNKHSVSSPHLDVDLCDDSSQTWLLSMFQSMKPDVLHLGPPCGTSSRARERDILASWKQKCVPCPKPLRDADNIWGVGGLSSRDKHKVERANKLYKFVATLLALALAANVIISKQNPERSWFWACLADCFRSRSLELSRRLNMLQAIRFDNCAWGGQRPKSTRWLSSPGAYQSLALQCPGESATHVHLPYSVEWTHSRWQFDTAGEGEYPQPLCEAVAMQASNAIDWKPAPTVCRPADEYAQSKRSRQLLPEFRTVVLCSATSLRNEPHKVLGPSSGVLFGDVGAPSSSSSSGHRPSFEVFAKGKRWTFSEMTRSVRTAVSSCAWAFAIPLLNLFAWPQSSRIQWTQSVQFPIASRGLCSRCSLLLLRILHLSAALFSGMFWSLVQSSRQRSRNFTPRCPSTCSAS